jgi:3,4-dihydroxy 2-butanone 4-phosphate synthase
MAPSEQQQQPNGTSKKPAFNTIPEAIEAFGTSPLPILSPNPNHSHRPSKITKLTLLLPLDTARGEPLVVLDSESRENEGDLIIAARAQSLDLPQMVVENEDPKGTAYTITVDAASDEVTTGISAHDRALTCRWLAEGGAGGKSLKGKADFRRPGHVVPLQARVGGVRERAGHTEAAVDFCRLIGCEEMEAVGVIAELVEDGEAVEGKGELGGNIGMLGRDGCLEFARRWGLVCVTVERLIEYLEERDGKKA